MNNIIFTFLIFLCSLTQCLGNEVNIALISNDPNYSLPYLDEIKEKYPYVNTEIIPYDAANFESFIESLFNESKKYDIFIYEIINLKYIAQYMSDLKQSISDEYLDRYNSNLIKESCIYKNKLVGLPFNFSIEVLYSNYKLLKKYNKTVPKTWSELIETCKYILSKEKDNPDLICYNGLFDDSDMGFYSLYQFIYSCRDSYDSPYPNSQDQSFVDSLNMLKKLKNEIASNDIFSSSENNTYMKLMNGKSIFLKYWLVGEPSLSSIPYKISNLPGLKEGISGSGIMGYLISVIKDLPKEKEDVVLNLIKYIASKEYQKKVSMDQKYLPTLVELLDDEELCKEIPCDITKNIQYIGEPKFIKEGSKEIKFNYKKYIYQYLYEDKSIKETVKQIMENVDIVSDNSYSLNSFGDTINVGYFSAELESQSAYLNLIKKQFPDVNTEILNYSRLSELKLLLAKYSKKYDIFIYDSQYTNIIAPYLLDLSQQLSKEHINMYDTNLISETGIYKDELVGLPVNLLYEVLYSNNKLLKKYNKPIPKTWNELIDTCKYILDKEKDDSELICYNGLLDDSDQGLNSLYEFIYSCRDSYDSEYPNPQDQSFVDSLKILKRLKEEIASDDIFSSNENFTLTKLKSQKSIFVKYWFLNSQTFMDHYDFSILPGLKEGISGSAIVGTNVGVNRYLLEEKEEKVFNVFKYITSKEYQKKFSLEQKTIPAITELLNDKEICIDVPCDFTKNIQYIRKPELIIKGPEEYRIYYKKYIYQYLYENKTIEQTVKNIVNLQNIYIVDLSLNDGFYLINPHNHLVTANNTSTSSNKLIHCVTDETESQLCFNISENAEGFYVDGNSGGLITCDHSHQCTIIISNIGYYTNHGDTTKPYIQCDTPDHCEAIADPEGITCDESHIGQLLHGGVLCLNGKGISKGFADPGNYLTQYSSSIFATSGDKNRNFGIVTVSENSIILDTTINKSICVNKTTLAVHEKTNDRCLEETEYEYDICESGFCIDDNNVNSDNKDNKDNKDNSNNSGSNGINLPLLLLLLMNVLSIIILN